jgi:antitoxin (DNA-binding transcriptional repressor) of toxin-antitoxin stability system
VPSVRNSLTEAFQCILKSVGDRVIHISDEEAASDFASLLDRVRAGAEVVIEHDSEPVALLRPALPSGPIDKVLAAIGRDVPDEDWSRVPTDLSKNLDHYLYGSPKATK